MKWTQPLTIVGLLLANLVLESNIFIHMNLWGLRPDSIVAVTIAVALVSGSGKGALYGVASGLIIDVLFSRYLGMYALGYTLIGFLVGFFTDKYYAHNAVFPGIAAFLAHLFKEGAMALQLAVIGARFEMGMAFWRYIVPSAVLTALITIPLYIVYRRNRRFEMRRAKWEMYPSLPALRNRKP